jgi:nicotinamide phosphoribosyltransferase
MEKSSIIFRTDSYKWGHWRQYLPDTERVYSYLESRNGARFNSTVFFGLQYLLKEYLSGQVVTQKAINAAEKLSAAHLGPGRFNRDGWQYILDRHQGRLPVKIRAVAEGTPVPVSNVQMTVENTDPKVPWLTNFLESILYKVWAPSVTATLSREIKILMKHYLEKTADNCDTLPFMLHDFGYRGAASEEAAMLNGAAHLINFLGTDTVPALLIPKNYYGDTSEAAGYSVLATEHSIMTSRGETGEPEVIKYLLRNTPDGILSIVIDSYDYRAFIQYMGEYLRMEVDAFLKRSPQNKIVFRPDSGEPVSTSLEVVQLVDRYFGCRLNRKWYRQLNPQTGVLWGDGIQYDSVRNILFNLKNNGYAASNMIFGMGGGLHTSCNRDTQRNAFKCSAQYYGEEWHDVCKKPLDSAKASKTGRFSLIKDENGNFHTVAKSSEAEDLLKPVFRNGEILREYTWDEIKNNAQL